MAASSPALLPEAVAVIVIGAAGPGANDARVQVTESPFTLHDQPLPDADAADTPERVLSTVTFWAVLGPLFAALSVKVTVPPVLTGFGAALIVSARSAESLMATVTLPEAVQEPLVMLMLIVAALPLPAVQTIEGVPLPPVIVPPEIVQLYVEPDCAGGTEAVLPVEPVGTEDGAWIVAVLAPEEMVIVREALALQPGPASSVALPPAQTAFGPVMLTDGAGLTVTATADDVALQLPLVTMTL
jgi:hypothetical protein